MHLYTVLLYLLDQMLSARCPKCDYLKTLLCFLGHVISSCKVLLDPSKAAAIHDMETPLDISYLYSSLGFMNFYKRLMLDYYTIQQHSLIQNWCKIDTTSFLSAPLLVVHSLYPKYLKIAKSPHSYIYIIVPLRAMLFSLWAEI